MNRLVSFLSESNREKDRFGQFLLVMVLAISCWIISTLFLQTTKEIAIKRFQLANPSFVQWAALAPVPAMYNYENRIQFSNEMLGDQQFNESHESWFSCTANHFPARCITFGEFAPKFYEHQRDGTFEMSTRFGDCELVSRWKIEGQPDGTIKVKRFSERWVQHDGWN